ncbi:MAG: hypothetical protein ACLSAJ_04050 [Intestinibacter bartlettii]|uniref:hypothetical protein n=1 Tax=Intestinibacter bartlettii TaxID=261299 RepID=UPI0039A1E110
MLNFEVILNDKEAPNRSLAAIGFNYWEQIYELEKDIKENYEYNEDFYNKRYETSLKN